MTVVAITLSASRGGKEVPDSVVLRPTESITPSGTSQATTGTPPRADYSAYWTVTNNASGAVWVKFGASPTAAANADWLLPAGQTMTLMAKAGQQVAVINA